jgi:transposase InsO family protein
MAGNKNEAIAIFRFGVIHEFVTGVRLSAEEKKRLLQEKCERKWCIPYSHRTRISANTIYRWIRRYQDSGGKIQALYPLPRNDVGKARKLDDETLCTIIEARKKWPHLTVPMLLEKLKQRLQVPGSVGLTTVYRLLHRHGLMTKKVAAEDRRKYEAAQPNDIWQSDVMHGPMVRAAGRQRKTYLIAFLDDHSRLIPYAGFYLSEKLSAFMDAFEKALAKRGLPRKLYVDNGAAYRSHKLEFTCASLSIALIHARPYKPQGKGKIERLFKTVRSGMLPQANTASLPQLNQSLEQWIGRYHQRKHSATGTTPFERFTGNLACIRKAPDDLRDHFRKAVYRTVAKDRTITLDGRLYEGPIPLIGKRVLLLYHENEPGRVEVFWEQKSHGMLVPVDLHVNCRVKRDRNKNTEIESSAKPTYKGGALWK